MFDVVKYHNDLNSVPLRRFSAVEMNIFTAVVQQLRSKQTEQVVISFDKLKTLIDWEHQKQSSGDFLHYLEAVTRHIVTLSGTRWSPDNMAFDVFVLFTWFHADAKKGELEVNVNPKFAYLLNDLGGQFTQYELSEYVNLPTTYSKALYRILKQYRTTGYVNLPIEKFRELIDVPKSYRISDIDKHVFSKQTRIFLANSFHDLKINKVYKKAPGKPVEGYTFTFKKESPDQLKKAIEASVAVLGTNPDQVTKEWNFRRDLEK